MCFWLWICMIIQVPFLCIQISEIDFRFPDKIVCIGKFNWLLLTPGNTIRKKWSGIYFEWEKRAKVISGEFPEMCTLASLFLYVKPLQSQAHVYMGFFSEKKSLFLWDFFTDMGLEWSQDWIYSSILLKNAHGRRIFD